MNIRSLISIAAASGILLATPATWAAPIVYFGEDLSPGGTVPSGGNAETARNDFLSSLVGVGNEDFETFASGTPITGSGINLSFPGSSGSISANLSGDDGGICSPGEFGPIGSLYCGFERFPSSGENYLQNGSNMQLDFSESVSAFGFYGTDFGDFNGVVTLNLVGGLTESFDIASTQGSPAGGNALFWGVIDGSNSFDSINFSATSGTDVFGFDDMVIGDQQQISVPEPGILSLLGMGLLGLGLGRKLTG